MLISAITSLQGRFLSAFRRSPALFVLLLSVLSFSCGAPAVADLSLSPSESINVYQAAVYAVVLSSSGLWWAFSESVRYPAVRGSGASGVVFGVLCLSVCLSEVVQVGQVVQVLGLMISAQVLGVVHILQSV